MTTEGDSEDEHSGNHTLFKWVVPWEPDPPANNP